MFKPVFPTFPDFFPNIFPLTFSKFVSQIFLDIFKISEILKQQIQHFYYIFHWTAALFPTGPPPYFPYGAFQLLTRCSTLHSVAHCICDAGTFRDTTEYSREFPGNVLRGAFSGNIPGNTPQGMACHRLILCQNESCHLWN